MSSNVHHEHDRPGDDDYLWDGSGKPDPEVAALEQALRPLRPHGHDAFLAQSRWARPRLLLYAVAAALLVAATGWLWSGRGGGAAPWTIEHVAGNVVIDGDAIRGVGELRVGEWLETGEAAQVNVRVADIGRLAVHGNSRLRVVRSRTGGEHRLELGHGRIAANVTAPPRLFVIDTPSVAAVDLGCSYELESDSEGTGLLRVTHGWVALEASRFTSTVPSGAACEIRAGAGPGVPYFEGTSARIIEALRVLDDASAAETTLTTIIDASTARDTLTLWHLLPRVAAAQRPRLIERMEDLAGMPPGVTPEAVEQLDAEALKDWWDDLERTW